MEVKSFMATRAAGYTNTYSGNIWYQVPEQNLSKKYFHAMRTWYFELPVDAEGWLDLCVRTWDNANNTQPTFVRSAW